MSHLHTLDQESSRGIHNIVLRSFDRVAFNWTGKHGARVFLRFNCLSTDFSRIKGVKGIPLRIHVESRVVDEPGNRVEKCICRARIFRDKVSSIRSWLKKLLMLFDDQHDEACEVAPAKLPLF